MPGLTALCPASDLQRWLPVRAKNRRVPARMLHDPSVSDDPHGSGGLRVPTAGDRAGPSTAPAPI